MKVSETALRRYHAYKDSSLTKTWGRSDTGVTAEAADGEKPKAKRKRKVKATETEPTTGTGTPIEGSVLEDQATDALLDDVL